MSIKLLFTYFFILIALITSVMAYIQFNKSFKSKKKTQDERKKAYSLIAIAIIAFIIFLVLFNIKNKTPTRPDNLPISDALQNLNYDQRMDAEAEISKMIDSFGKKFLLKKIIKLRNGYITTVKQKDIDKEFILEQDFIQYFSDPNDVLGVDYIAEHTNKTTILKDLQILKINLQIFDIELKKDRQSIPADASGNTRLHYAAQKANLVQIKVLLDQGINIHRKNKQGQTALHLASIANNRLENKIEVLEYLIENDAEVNNVDFSGNTPFLLSAYQGSDKKILKLFIEKGADINHVNSEGKTALYIMAEQGFDQEVNFLCQQPGVDTIENKVYVGNDMFTALSIAIRKKHENTALTLINQCRANVSILDDGGNSLLHLAVQNDMVALARILIANGIDIDVENNAGQTPLMLVKGITMAKTLLQHGANKEASDYEGKNVFDYVPLAVKELLTYKDLY